jgi:hypothetical protein
VVSYKGFRAFNGEPAVFGKPARWVDYNGPVAEGKIEGITTP